MGGGGGSLGRDPPPPLSGRGAVSDDGIACGAHRAAIVVCNASGITGRRRCTVSQADEGAVRIPKDRPSYFDISKVPIDGQMSNAFNDNICLI